MVHAMSGFDVKATVAAVFLHPITIKRADFIAVSPAMGVESLIVVQIRYVHREEAPQSEWCLWLWGSVKVLLGYFGVNAFHELKIVGDGLVSIPPKLVPSRKRA